VGKKLNYVQMCTDDGSNTWECSSCQFSGDLGNSTGPKESGINFCGGCGGTIERELSWGSYSFWVAAGDEKWYCTSCGFVCKVHDEDPISVGMYYCSGCGVDVVLDRSDDDECDWEKFSDFPEYGEKKFGGFSECGCDGSNTPPWGGKDSITGCGCEAKKFVSEPFDRVGFVEKLKMLGESGCGGCFLGDCNVGGGACKVMSHSDTPDEDEDTFDMSGGWDFSDVGDGTTDNAQYNTCSCGNGTYKCTLEMCYSDGSFECCCDCVYSVEVKAYKKVVG